MQHNSQTLISQKTSTQISKLIILIANFLLRTNVKIIQKKKNSNTVFFSWSKSTENPYKKKPLLDYFLDQNNRKNTTNFFGNLKFSLIHISH
jgi:hypothetical protein